MSKFYFTFGSGQKYENGYHVIEAEDIEIARNLMFNKFGSKWSMVYTEDRWMLKNGKTQAEEYNLNEVVQDKL